jgi:hypothetical protein
MAEGKIQGLLREILRITAESAGFPAPSRLVRDSPDGTAGDAGRAGARSVFAPGFSQVHPWKIEKKTGTFEKVVAQIFP